MNFMEIFLQLKELLAPFLMIFYPQYLKVKTQVPVSVCVHVYNYSVCACVSVTDKCIDLLFRESRNPRKWHQPARD